jgi:hypothetical protein
MPPEGLRETGEALVVSVTPDVCLTPMGATPVPVPYPIVGKFDDVVLVVKSVRMCGRPTFTTASQVTKVMGDEAGTAGGVKSGVNMSICESVTASGTVRAEGNHVLRDGDVLKMNNGNTLGKVVFKPGEGPMILGEHEGGYLHGLKSGLKAFLEMSKGAAKNAVLGPVYGAYESAKSLANLVKDPAALYRPYAEAYESGGFTEVLGRATPDIVVLLISRKIPVAVEALGSETAAAAELNAAKTAATDTAAAADTAAADATKAGDTAELDSTERPTAEMDAVDPDDAEPTPTPAADGVTVTGTPPAPLHFGPNDLVYGPSARGALRRLQQEAGGQLLTDLPKPDGTSWKKFTTDTLADAASSGRQVHFDLTNMKDLDDVLANQGKYADATTSVELRYIRDKWDTFETKPKFYRDGAEVPAPF